MALDWCVSSWDISSNSGMMRSKEEMKLEVYEYCGCVYEGREESGRSRVDLRAFKLGLPDCHCGTARCHCSEGKYGHLAVSSNVRQWAPGVRRGLEQC